MMQDSTPLKEAGADILGGKYGTYWTQQLIHMIQDYIDLQVHTLNVLVEGDIEAAHDAADQSNDQLQKIALHIGADYIGPMQARIAEIIQGE